MFGNKHLLHLKTMLVFDTFLCLFFHHKTLSKRLETFPPMLAGVEPIS